MQDATYYASSINRVDGSALRALGHRDSVRGKQRALALIVGHLNDGCIDAPQFRSLCIKLGCHNKANFTVNMKKDSTLNAERALWTVHTYRGGRGSGRGINGHWCLTQKGAALAAEYIALIDAAIAFINKTVTNTIKIVARAQNCPYCWEPVEDTDRADCSSCPSKAHATCVEEFHAHSDGDCALRLTVTRCYGSYETVAKPETVDTEATVAAEEN